MAEYGQYELYTIGSGIVRYYRMRAPLVVGGYASWLVQNLPDPTGVYAPGGPSAILPPAQVTQHWVEVS